MGKKNTLKTKRIETSRKITMFVYARKNDWEYTIITYWKELELLTYQEVSPFHIGSPKEDNPTICSKSKRVTLEWANRYFEECSECARFCENYDWDSFTDTMSINCEQ